jgi:hypothetical protein
MLKRIRDTHEGIATQLRQAVSAHGGVPVDNAGRWGGFENAVQGSRRFRDESPALKVLEEGEHMGIREYRDALAEPDVSRQVKDLIRSKLLPALMDQLFELQRRRFRSS